MGKKGEKARAKGRAYHSNVEGTTVYHTQADCLGGSRIRRTFVKPGAGDGLLLCGACARRAA